ncbi:DUF202 domain-containing protein [Arthrobacter halodurans]|uniref:DUF202 domain-containing protein n=1 Tax=Arthrobacter halodurans TaxID=516699 RepID=A0ABV4UL56_9MICC
MRPGPSPPQYRPHGDAGLQPERTVMAWGRTMVSFLVASAVFLRWLPHYGPAIAVLVGLATAAALGIYATQRRRYARHAAGIQAGALRADVAAVLWTTGLLLALGATGLLVLLSA